MTKEAKKIIGYLPWAAALVLPLFLVALFEGLKGSKALMDGWVSGVMAPVEQFLGRLWSVFPFSVAEVLTALVLAGSVFWIIRAVVLVIRRREGKAFLRRLLALACAVLWLWAAVCWMWNAAYYASGFQEKSGLTVEPYSVETLAQVTALFAQRAAEYSTQVARDEYGLFAEDTGGAVCPGRAHLRGTDKGISLPGAGGLRPGQAPCLSPGFRASWALPGYIFPSPGRPT